ILQEFNKFDITENGYLSGTEVTACNCKNYDTNGDNRITKEEFFTGRGGKVPGGGTAATKAATLDLNQPAQQGNIVKEQPAGNCNFDPPAPDYQQSDAFSLNIAKRILYKKYNWYANGTVTAPLRVGVAFTSFTALTPYKNTVKVEPGRGAVRLNDAAPPYIMIYPVRSRHIVCEEYKSGITRYQVESEYDCFKSKDGEWTCGSSGIKPPKITQLK
ncbi:MAG TPA: hypothetical protein VGB56_14420, partial [Flavisolibacter sp.]